MEILQFKKKGDRSLFDCSGMFGDANFMILCERTALDMISHDRGNRDIINDHVRRDNTFVYSMYMLDLLPVIQVNPETMCIESCNASACIFMSHSISLLKGLKITRICAASCSSEVEDGSDESCFQMSRFAFRRFDSDSHIFYMDADGINVIINNESKLYLYNLNNLQDCDVDVDITV